MQDQEVFLTVEEIATRLQVGEPTVRRWIRTDQLPAIQINRQYRITKSDFDTFLRKRKKKKK